MESKIESGPSDNTFSRKEDDSSCIAVSGPLVKSRACNKQKNTSSGALLSSSSSHDLSLKNAESKETFGASAAHDASEDFVVSQKVILVAVENNKSLKEQTSSAAGSLGSRTSDSHQRKASDIAEEKHREEDHTDTNSPISGFRGANHAIHACLGGLDKKVIGCSPGSTESMLSKNDEKAIQKEAAHDCNNSEVEENQAEFNGNGKFSLKNSTISSFRDDVLCHKIDGVEDPPSSSNASPKAQYPCSSSPRNGSLSQCSMDDEKSPIMEKLDVDSIIGKKDFASGEVSKEDSGISQPRLIFSKRTDECLGTENGDNSKFQPHEAIKCGAANEHADKPKSNSQLPEVPLQRNSVCEVSTEIEDVVKVCDICGDAGQEELLAICSRCSDGAEHTYCMRIRLDKVPEGEWLCEECQLKEAQNQKIGKSESRFEAIEALCSNENSQSIGSTSKSFPCVEKKEIDPDIRSDNKELGSTISSKRKGENLEVTSFTKEKISEACGVSGTTIPRKSTLLSCENSFNTPDIVKVKPSALVTSCHQSEGISQPGAYSQTSSNSDSSKLQACLEPTRGSLLKSVSFNNSKVPKVKQLLENIPHKQKMTRESNSSTTRKEGPLRAITKSTSFRLESSGISNVETLSKVQSPRAPQSEDPRGVKQVKERSTIDKKNSTSDHPFGSPSVSATSVSCVVDPKIPQYDAKLKRTSNSSNLGNNRGSNVVTSFANEVKNQLSSTLSRTSGSTSSIRSSKNEDEKAFQLVPKAAELMHKNDKAEDHTFLGNSKRAASVGNRSSHCQRCHETGHATHFCAVDKLCMSATKPSSERTLKDVDNSRSNKWKDTVEVFTLKCGTKKTARSSDQSEEVSLSSADVNSEVTCKDFLSSSLSSRNLYLVEGAADAQDFSKPSNAIHGNQKVEDHKKAIFLPRKGSDLDFMDDLNMRLIVQMLPNQVSMPMHLLRPSVIPELDCIWQGAFEVLRTAKPPAIFDGFQAHLSTYVSPEALELATKFPCRVQLEEVPRLSSWPFQFQNSPKEDNIALFFFAKDIESFEKYYWKLLENMIKNDLALIGNIDALELLIFPSNVLPENSQCWNKLFYLWGVFRGRKRKGLGDLPCLEKKPSISNLNLEPTVQDLPIPIVSGFCSSHDISDEYSQELSRCDRSSEAFKSSTCTDLQDIPTSANEDPMLNKGQPLVQKTLHQVVADCKVLTEQTSCSFPATCSFTNMSHPPNVPVAYPEPKLEIDIEQLPLEMENDLTNLVKLTSDPDSRKDSEYHVHAGSIRISDCEDLTPSVSLNCQHGNDRDVQKTNQKENVITDCDLDNHISENAVNGDHLSWELRPNRKRAQPSSVETIKNYSGHMFKPTADTMLCKDEESCTSQSDEKEQKKMKLGNGGHATCSSREETLSSRLSSKIQPLPSGFMNDSIYCESISERSKNAERYFLPIDFGPATSTKADNLIYVLSSDGEDYPESKAPDIELALGGKKRPTKQDTLPLLSPKVGEKNNQDKPPASAADDGDDTLASLSLSLAFPASEKAAAKTISQAEQLLPDKPCSNTSLLLFGGSSDA